MEGWAKNNGVDLALGWKVDVARELINNFDRAMKDIPYDLETKWITLFETLINKK